MPCRLANNLNQITLDDGNLAQNPDPIIYPPPQLTALNTVRSGDEVSDIVGVFTQGNPGWTSAGNLYRIYPFAMPTFTATNPRPAGARSGARRRLAARQLVQRAELLPDSGQRHDDILRP